MADSLGPPDGVHPYLETLSPSASSHFSCAMYLDTARVTDWLSDLRTASVPVPTDSTQGRGSATFLPFSFKLSDSTASLVALSSASASSCAVFLPEEWVYAKCCLSSSMVSDGWRLFRMMLFFSSRPRKVSCIGGSCTARHNLAHLRARSPEKFSVIGDFSSNSTVARVHHYQGSWCW